MSGAETPKPTPTEAPLNLYEQLRANVEKRAEVCAGFSRRFFEHAKVSADDITTKAKKHFDITIDVKDDKSLALGTFDLQRKLGFPAEQNDEGCDGMYGPYTNLKLEEFITRKTTAAGLGELQKGIPATPAARPARTPLDSAAPPARPPAIIRPAESRETSLPEISMREAWPIGDSLSVGYTNVLPKRHIPEDKMKYDVKIVKVVKTVTVDGKKTKIEEKKEVRFPTAIDSAVGGSLTSPMLRRMRDDIKNKRRPGVKTVIISGGVNDVGSGLTAEQTISNLRDMAQLARDNGIKVVLCTIPAWDIPTYVTSYKKGFCIKHKMTIPILNDRMAAINNWIKQQGQPGGLADSVVDLYTELGPYKKLDEDQRKGRKPKDGLERNDFVHFANYSRMAQAITRDANIKPDRPAVS